MSHPACPAIPKAPAGYVLGGTHGDRQPDNIPIETYSTGMSESRRELEH
jgi:hypothetical protein